MEQTGKQMQTILHSHISTYIYNMYYTILYNIYIYMCLLSSIFWIAKSKVRLPSPFLGWVWWASLSRTLRSRDTLRRTLATAACVCSLRSFGSPSPRSGCLPHFRSPRLCQPELFFWWDLVAKAAQSLLLRGLLLLDLGVEFHGCVQHLPEYQEVELREVHLNSMVGVKLVESLF